MKLLVLAVVATVLGFGVAYALSERTLATYPSVYNGSVIVSETFDGIRKMTFGGDTSVQSAINTIEPERIVSPYARAAIDVLSHCPNHRYRLLVLGLGGGVIPNAVRRLCPLIAVDAVEIDPAVVRAAMQWFDVTGDLVFSVYIQDAVAFVRDRARDVDGARYDAVLVDIFSGTSAPPSSELRPFVVNVRGVLAPGGVVVLNLLSAQYNPQHDRVAALYASVFGRTEVKAVGSSGNFLLVAHR